MAKDLPPASAGNFLEAARERLQVLIGTRGSPLDQALTPRMLGWSALPTTAGGAVVRPSGGAGGSGLPGTSGGGGSASDDLTPPPSVAGLAVSAGVTNLFVQIDAPLYTWGGGNKQTNIYGASKDKDDPVLPTFGDAQVIYTMPAALTLAAIPSEPGRRWHIWVKHESYAGVESVSPAGGINGQSATLGDAENLIESLQAATAWIDSAMVANLSAAHLTVGDGTVGGPLRSTNYVPNTSGWLLDSALGRLYAMDAVLSGTIYANYGNIGGWSIFSSGIESPGYDGTSGVRLDPDSGIIAHSGSIGGLDLVSGGLQSPGFSSGSGFRIDPTQGSIKNQSGSRILNLGATGSQNVFDVDGLITAKADGSLTIGALNVVGTHNIQPGAVTASGADTNADGVTIDAGEVGVASISIQTGSSPVYIHAKCSAILFNESAGGDTSIEFRIYQNSSVIKSKEFTVLPLQTVDAYFSEPIYVGSTGSGITTYSVKIFLSGGEGRAEVTAGDAVIFALALKR